MTGARAEQTPGVKAVMRMDAQNADSHSGGEGLALPSAAEWLLFVAPYTVK